MTDTTRAYLSMTVTCVISLATLFAGVQTNAAEGVHVTEKEMVIPTYEVLDPDPNPIFFDGATYQGAQRRVYPYPLQDRLSQNKIDKTYQAIILENEYIEVCILPELGGRIHYAIDKTNGYDFLYHNHVIKPALIGMTGAWISGGCEWNIPHHHRASSYTPVENKTVRNADGSVTVWVGETELRHGMRWLVGHTLRPGIANIEVDIRLFNTTPQEESILIWANPAVHANEDYQVVFPPSTQFATHHKKFEFTEWPISHQMYGGGDYRAGVDVSMWKNHSATGSYFAWGNSGNFVAGYDHGKQAGTIVWGDRHTNTGKKFFSWGNHANGHRWYERLTDEDGPYIELMFGAFSDNQPDYSWIDAGQTKQSVMNFMPVRDLGSIKEVNAAGAAELTVDGSKAQYGFWTTQKHEDATSQLWVDGRLVEDRQAEVNPAHPFVATTEQPAIASAKQVTVRLLDEEGKTLLAYTHQPKPKAEMPAPAIQPKPVGEIDDPEDLYLTGRQLEQLHDSQFDPRDYYRKAIENDRNFWTAYLRLGQIAIKRFDYELAEKYLEDARRILTRNYLTPEDGAVDYYLALVKDKLGEHDEAVDLFNRAAWDNEYEAAAYYELARMAASERRMQQAEEFLRKTLRSNPDHLEALQMMIAVLRQKGQAFEVRPRWTKRLEQLDPLNLHVLYERYQASHRNVQAQAEFMTAIDQAIDGERFLAASFAQFGFIDDAIAVLELARSQEGSVASESPMTLYYLAHLYSLAGDAARASATQQEARKTDLAFCFPNSDYSIDVLQQAIQRQPNDAVAHYLLGNAFYDRQPQKAIVHWNRAIELGMQYPTLYRNLAFGYAKMQGDFEKACSLIDQAIAFSGDDPLYFAERDEYASRLGHSAEQRLAAMRNSEEVVTSSVTSLFPFTNLLVAVGEYDHAFELMKTRMYRHWEGYETIHPTWARAHLIVAGNEMEQGNIAKARQHIEAAMSYPVNLVTGYDRYERVGHYYLGLLAEQQGDASTAQEHFDLAAEGISEPDEFKYYAGKALEKLGRSDEANEKAHRALIAEGNAILTREGDRDYFNPFAKKETAADRKAKGHYLLSLGYLGIGSRDQARDHWSKARQLNPTLVSVAMELDLKNASER